MIRVVRKSAFSKRLHVRTSKYSKESKKTLQWHYSAASNCPITAERKWLLKSNRHHVACWRLGYDEGYPFLGPLYPRILLCTRALHCPYTEPAQSSPYNSILSIFKIDLNIKKPAYALVYLIASFFPAFPPIVSVHTSSLFVLHALPSLT